MSFILQVHDLSILPYHSNERSVSSYRVKSAYATGRTLFAGRKPRGRADGGSSAGLCTDASDQHSGPHLDPTVARLLLCLSSHPQHHDDHHGNRHHCHRHELAITQSSFFTGEHHRALVIAHIDNLYHRREPRRFAFRHALVDWFVHQRGNSRIDLRRRICFCGYRRAGIRLRIRRVDCTFLCAVSYAGHCSARGRHTRSF